MIARQQGRELTEIASEANAVLVAGSSLKAALDQDWDDRAQCEQALGVVLAALTAVERWLETAPEGHDAPVVAFSMTAAKPGKRAGCAGEFARKGHLAHRSGQRSAYFD